MTGRFLHILRRAGIAVATLAGLAGLLLLAGYWYLQSESGRDHLVEILNRQLSTAGEIEVRIGRLEGDLLKRIEIFDFSLGDRDGSWLQIGRISASWRPLALLAHRLSISRLDIDGLSLLRQPLGGESADEFQWPELPLKLSIEAFSIDDIVIEPAVFGEKLRFKASGETAVEGPDLVRTSLLVTRTDGVYARARLQAMFQPRSKFLRFELLVDEASGGVISRALALEGLPAISIKANGEGPLDQLRGHVDMRAGDLAFIEGNYRVAVGDQTSLKLHGRAQVAGLVEAPLRRLLDSDVEFVVNGMLDNGNIQLQRGFFANDLASIEVSGMLRGFIADFNVTMDLKDLTPLSDIAGIPLQGQARLTTRVHAADIRRTVLASDIQASFSGVLPAASPWLPLVGPAVKVSGELEFDTTGQWGFHDLVITADTLTLAVSGSLKDFATDFNLTVTVDNLLPLSDIAGLPLQGQANLHTRIQSDDIRIGALATNIRASFAQVLPATSPWLPLVGPGVQVSGNIEFDSERHWGISDLLVTADAGQLSATGTIGLDAETLALDYQLQLPRLAVLSATLGTPLGGSLKVAGAIGGSLAAPRLTAILVSPALTVAQIKLGTTEARVNITKFDSNMISGDVQLSIENSDYGRLELASKFSTQADDRLQLQELKIDSRKTRLVGNMIIDLSRATATGRMSARDFTLAPWSDLAGRQLSGIANLSLDLSGSDKGQQLDLTVNATGLNVELDPRQSVRVEAARLSARLEDIFGNPSGAMRLLATNAKVATAEFASIAFEARMDDPLRWQGRLQLQGDLQGPFEIDVSADYSAGDQGFVVTLLELDASVFEQAIKLSKPTRLQYDGVTTSLAASTLSVADGSLTMSGELGADHIRARFDAEGISIAALLATVANTDFSGRLSAHARISGTRAAPTGELDLTVVDMQTTLPRLEETGPISGELRGEWLNQRLHLRASLAGFAQSSISASASLPLQLDPETLALTMPTNKPIDGKLNWTGDLEPIWNLISNYEDRFTGPGEIAMVVHGNLDNPRIGGHFEVTGGRYENLQTATTLVEVNLRLTGDGDKLVLEKLTASDGKTGSLVGSGFIDFIPTQSYPVHLRLALSDMRLVTQDNLTLSASGKLSLEGNLSNTLLSGEIVTGQSQINLGSSLPPSIVDLEVEEINLGSAKNAQPANATTPAESSIVVLDLAVSVPGRAYVRGLGLESEWMGDILLSGRADAPRLTGALRPVRGRFFLMGKNFRLEQGSIRFTGSEDIDPVLDLTAEYKANALTALVRVTGSASRPKILLTSRPPLPESEIASQVLFGTNSGNLTTAQSLQLASAIATFSGNAGAIGILDATRRVLRVDVINFTESEADAAKTRVSVGKYVSEGVYLEVEGGTEKDSRTSTTIEVDVLPNIRVEGGTTETGGAKAGIKWKWDY